MARRQVVVVAALAFVIPSVALAATFVVDNNFDSIDANPGDGVCADSRGACTLRAAILEANATVAPDLIELPRGHYLLSVEGDYGPGGPLFDEDDGLTGDLDIYHTLELVGSGSAGDTTIDGNERVRRVLEVHIGAVVGIRNVTITGGLDDFLLDGIGIRNQGQLDLQDCKVVDNWADSGDGGGILNRGVLRVRRCEIARNFADDCGGLRNFGTATVEHSTFHSNDGELGGAICADRGDLVLRSSTVHANRGFFGGGVYVGRDGSMLIENSTISGNEAYGCGGIFGRPGLVVRSSTIARNTAEVGVGGICDGTVGSSIIAENRATGIPGVVVGEIDECRGVVSTGHNLIGMAEPDCLTNVQPSDLIGTPAAPIDPRIEDLDFNGGLTPTHALLPDSPAIDAGGLDCLFTDQRGVARPVGAACDIGAFEEGGFPEDQDGDGEHDSTDACPGTPLGAPVDQAGCSQAGFCSSFPANTAKEKKVCKSADWRNDQPLWAGDCRVLWSKGVPSCVAK